MKNKNIEVRGSVKTTGARKSPFDPKPRVRTANASIKVKGSPKSR